MNKSRILLLTVFLGIYAASNAQTRKKATTTTTRKTTTTASSIISLKNETDSLSYAIGVEMAKFYKSQGINNLNLELLNKALKDGMSETGKTLMTDEVANNVMNTTAQKIAKRKSEETKKEGVAFLAQNKTKEGVVTLPDGLQYKIIKAGTGPKPKADDKVKVHYVGKLLNGQEFDNSIKRGEPLDIDVNGVIKGWTEALQLMPVGSKWQLYIPSELAYGDRQAGPDIKPGSTLIFDVELLDIVKPTTATDSTNTSK
ncbi:MAG: peptidylprolyl isomerase [Pseudopedobacter saltans]|uniref:Peptidyl-prolyl cis-trans isomerase n=1 Tax=Pseudopedobacter saltans TaxID=151895 RepID=A0A2W5EL54_9SPHI|nr:MAG: peptidylprolyl isomerase [Pseudopedobacter saltans]